MGYSTEFYGEGFKLDRPADEALQKTLRGLSTTRRMARNVAPEYGVEGEFYFEGTGSYGQDHDPTIIDYNKPPRTQPGLWCQWELQDDNITITCDEGEKFYDYIEWLQYIIDSVLKPRGYVLKGEIVWQGDDRDDMGIINVTDNTITLFDGEVVYRERK